MLTVLLHAWAGPAVLELPSGPRAMAPHVMPTPDGLRLTWLEPRAGGHALLTSALSAGWSEPTVVAESAELVANWADTPNAVVAGDGSLVVSYPRKSGSGTYAYDVVVAHSEKGRAWTELGSPHSDGTETEHGFTSLLPEGRGFRVFWLDGRLTASGGPMTFQSALWDGVFSEESEIDGRVCDCCGTAATLTADGWMAVYRDRSIGDVRDTRAAVPGKTLSVGADGWQMPGCPVNGPRVVATEGGQMVAWTTGAGGELEVRIAFGGVGGFGPSQVLAASSGTPSGRVDLVALGSTVIASWLGSDAVWAQRLQVVDGLISGGPMVRLGDASASRSTGFPRIAVRDERLVAVWTSEGRLAGVSLPVAELLGTVTRLPVVQQTASAPLVVRPDLEGNTLDGVSWNLSEVHGTVLVSLWASWCGPCRAELPALKTLAAANPELQLVVVAVDDNAPSIRKAAKERPGTWVTASRASVQKAFRTSAIPANWLFASDGNVSWSDMGALDLRGVSEAISGTHQ